MNADNWSIILGDSSSGQFGSAGQSADPCGGMTLKISTSTDLRGKIEGASRGSPCVFGSSSASDDPLGSSSKAWERNGT